MDDDDVGAPLMGGGRGGVAWTGRGIAALRLYARAPLLARLDALPFAALYAALCVAGLRGMLSRFTFLAGLGCVVSLHVLCFLAQYWSVRVHASVAWRAVRAPAPGVCALVMPRAHRGKAEMVGVGAEDGRVGFAFQKRTYEWEAARECFVRVEYPTECEVAHYARYVRGGGMGGKGVEEAQRRFGKNKLEIPLPTFREQFVEHLLAPFFVFQVFCILLWMLDGQPWHCLLTLFMMLTFEATMVMNRLRSLRELRGMRNRVQNVFVFRDRKWTAITSLDLLPGDVLSVPRAREADDVVPCDLLVLGGTAVVNEAMLTGESVPLMKEAISEDMPGGMHRPLDMKEADKAHVIFGGTRVLTHTPPVDTTFTPAGRPPDGGCVCYVLRTGFGSSQGTLMRTILYSTESVSANSLEAALLILLLLVFALAASGYVLYHRYSDDADARYKLLLRCVLIITSVVPPELPMQLSLAVNTSLVALARAMVFCTEPFRIPYAGKIDICGFDKTGTITTDTIEAVGVAHPPGAVPRPAAATVVAATGGKGGKGGKAAAGAADAKEGKTRAAAADEAPADGEFAMVAVAESSMDAAMVLAACHSLVHVENEVVGDPLEVAALGSVEWNFGSSGTAVPKRGGSSSASCTILQRFRFSSALQRMSVVARIRGSAVTEGHRVLTKGSPEAVARLLAPGSLPKGYHESAQGLARRGLRVLALAYRDVDDNMTLSEIDKMSRESAESDLQFAGFVCFECPLRPDSRKVVRALTSSSHSVVMVTGDATLTAAHVARQVRIANKSILILEESKVTSGTLEWVSAATGVRKKKFIVEKVPALADDYDLCVSGPALEMAIELDKKVLSVLMHVKVFARTSPTQKEMILTSFKDNGLHTLFCGDGTNDVGALKQAHIGVALLSGVSPTPAKKPDGAATGRVSQAGSSGGQGGTTADKKGLRQRKKQQGNSAAQQQQQQQQQAQARKTPREMQQEQLQRTIRELKAGLEENEDQAPLVKLGDASVASPFTSRRMTIASCVTIIRQGRCTLATTSQMYQILALNCLISAYSLSVLYLEGIAFGERQMMITGVVMAIAFFMISRSKPLEKLSVERPPTSIFAPQLFMSLLGQFAVHLYSLYYLTEVARGYVPYGPRMNIDADFRPSVINSVIFLLSVAQQVSVFTVNYKGRPFMQGLLDNRMLLRSLLFVGGIVVLCTAELSPDLNDLMQLTPWPDARIQSHVAAYVFGDFAAAWAWDKLMYALLGRRTRARRARA